jgi:glycosyltransferase involved in cell wall biosynthesis
MRILHVLHQYLPDHVGGTEHYTRALSLAQQKAGHQLAIFCRKSGTGQRLDHERSEGAEIFRVIDGSFTPQRRFRATFSNRFLAQSLAHAVEEVQPDVIHIQHLMGLPAGFWTKSQSMAPVVVTLHDYWWICANAQLITDYGGTVCDGPSCWLNCARCGLARAGAGAAWPLSPLFAPLFAWRASALRRLIPRVAAWIAPTAFVGNWHKARGFPAERLHVVGHGIEMPPQDILTLSAGQPHRGEATQIAYVGGLAPQKGVHVLIEAFNELSSFARLTIAGDETAFPNYCAGLHRLATHPGITFRGRLDRKDVWQVLSAADALVVPSLWYETASLVVQEAFAVGTPVIAANHGALAERVRHGIDGLLVEPGDVQSLLGALRRLIEEPGLASRLKGGIGPVMSITEHAQQVEAVYRRLGA